MGFYPLDDNAAIKNDKTAYDRYMGMYAGVMNNGKMASIEKAYDDMVNVDSTLASLEDSFQKGEITKEQFFSGARECETIKRESPVIKLFYNKCLYARKDAAFRYVIEDRGWERLLATEQVDYVLIILLSLLLIPVFCNEYESEMDALLLTGTKGRRCLLRAKLALGMGVASILAVVFDVVGYCHWDNVYGLSMGNAPIQSLGFFGDSVLGMTMLQAYLAVLSIRVVGAVFLAQIIFLHSIVLKKSLPTFFLTVVIVFLPSTVSNWLKFKYILPLPTGLLNGVGYLWPDQSSPFFNFDLPEAAVEEASVYSSWQATELALFFSGVIIIMLLIPYLLSKRYLNEKVRLGRRTGLVAAVIFSVALCYSLGGCATGKDMGKENFYKVYETGKTVFCSGKFMFSLENMNDLMMTNIDTGKSHKIIRDPFLSNDEDYGISYFVSKDNVYYSMSTGRGFRIYKISLSDFTETVEYGTIPDNVGLTRVNDFSASRDQDAMKISDICITDGYRYYRDAELGILYQNDKKTGETKKIGITNSHVFSANGLQRLYFVNNTNQPVEFDEKTGKTTTMEYVQVDGSQSRSDRSIFVTENNFYYSNALDSNKIYGYSFGDKSLRKVLDAMGADSFVANDAYGYFIDNNKDNNLFKVDLESGDISLVLEENCKMVSIGDNGQRLAVMVRENDGVAYKILFTDDEKRANGNGSQIPRHLTVTAESDGSYTEIQTVAY
jgi:hypothetical protein